MLRFMESYARKVDAVPSACLWVGTSLGVVLVIALSIPTDEEERLEEPVTVMPSGELLLDAPRTAAISQVHVIKDLPP